MDNITPDVERTQHEPASLTGVVKWFDPQRGFGFVLVPGFDDEFLLHENVLRNYGQDNVADGATIEFSFAKQNHGLRVTEISSISVTVRSIEYEDLMHPDRVWSDFVPARVRWYDRAKGYGFVTRYGCAEDIFVGSDVLKRIGLQELSFGQALCVQVCEAQGRKRVHAIQDWPTTTLSGRSTGRQT